MPRKTKHRPRVGIPWRTAKQERADDTRYNRDYIQAVKNAGGEPVSVSLLLPPDKLNQLAASLDAIVLPGSPADVNPRLYRSKSHKKTAKADVKREKTDIALLQDAFANGKPVLAICYGTQLLNVHLGGTLVQDIDDEVGSKIRHEPDGERGEPVTLHDVLLKRGHLAKLAGRGTVRVNSSHHQSILRPGRGLRVTAYAPDGVVEAVERTDGAWVVGVQWHPERMGRDAKRGRKSNARAGALDTSFARALFSRLVTEAHAAGRRSGNLRDHNGLHVKSGEKPHP